MRQKSIVFNRIKCAAAAAVVLGMAVARHASAQTSVLGISESQISPTLYQYSLTLGDTASSATPIGTLWYAWTPGQDYLTTSPTAITEPAGWAFSTISHGGGADGYAIRWVATAPTNAVQPGGSLSGFSFETTDPPSTIFGDSQFFPTTPTSTFVTYSGDSAFSGTSVTSVGTAIPEPASLAILTPLALLLGRRRAR